METLEQQAPIIREICTVLLHQTENTNASFFKAELAYFLCKTASLMGVTLHTKDKGSIPVNGYVVALANSGFGKGHSINILEQQVFHRFNTVWLEELMPAIAEKNMKALAKQRFRQQHGDRPLEDFEALLYREYEDCGQYNITFDSATPAAVKQLRHKLLLAQCGSINFQQDEMGSYLQYSNDLLTLFLELYDQGMVKPKLIKNTRENVRTKEIAGKTLTNMLLFGTPHKLFDGGTNEDAFFQLLEIGHARRCFFGWGESQSNEIFSQTAQEIYQNRISSKDRDVLRYWSDQLCSLVNEENHGMVIDVPDSLGIEITDYRLQCNMQAAKIPGHRELERAELSHRYFKAMKLAGALAFINKTPSLTHETWNYARQLTEDSGKAYLRILHREKNHVRLAKYLRDCGEATTHVDLMEALPFYKGSMVVRQEMMLLASSWGYKNHVLIRRNVVDGVELFSASSLEQTNLEALTVSYSTHLAQDYESATFPFSQISKLTTTKGIHWCNHGFTDGYRKEANALLGFNMVVLDIDGTATIGEVELCLAKWVYYLHTTKSHSEDSHHFRVVLPISHRLYLSREDYRQCIQSLLDSLPFSSDVNAAQRARKWEAFFGAEEHRNDTGKLFDILPYIPNTTRNEEWRRQKKAIADTGALEQWFILHCEEIGRNNSLYRYGKALLDKREGKKTVLTKVIALNKRLNNPLPKEELDQTILTSLMKESNV